MTKTIGLLVMAYGTPRKTEEIEQYYTHIRGGRKPTEDQLEELKARYERIGGLSPLTDITDRQVQGLEAKLNQFRQDLSFKAYLGLKHIDPFIEDAVQAMHQEGIQEAVSIVLAPHYSTLSVKTYHQRALEEAERLGGPMIHSIDAWYEEPAFIDYWVKELKQTFHRVPKEEQEKTAVIFSAHSLPERILQFNDPYPEQVQHTAEMIAKKAGVKHFAVGWQSAGKSPEPWLGPDVKDLTKALYDSAGYRAFIYCPVGFVSDHLEVLYDNDVECKQVTQALGVKYLRPPMPNANESFLDALADAVIKKLVEKAVI